MNKRVKKKWLKALRSGEYKQGREVLCKLDRKGEERFCCLGVLLDIEADGYWELDENYYLYKDKANVCDAIPPEEFTENLGIFGNERDELIRKNDNGASFKQIANWIEKNL